MTDDNTTDSASVFPASATSASTDTPTPLNLSPADAEAVATTPQRPRRSAKRQARQRSKSRGLLEWGAVLVAALLIAVGLRTFAFQVFYVPSTSMVPALLVGDRILVDKFLFDYHDLKRGDVIVFARQQEDTMCGANETDLVKRVIGLPGQTISEVNGKVLINGKVINESYLPSNDPLGSEPIVTETIPQNQFFVLGDNRSVSCDSRYWGTVSGPTIVGKVVAVIWRNNRPAFHGF